MQRLIAFAHYDPQAMVDAHVRYLLQALRDHCDRLVFVTTSGLTVDALAALQLPATDLVSRENVGLDFCSWKAALAAVGDWHAFDEIVFCNDSVYGPLHPLEAVFDEMSYRKCDFWGITDSTELGYHVQSYFVVFRSAVVHSGAFRQFVDGIVPIADKKELIRTLELGLTQSLRRAGFQPAAFFRPGLAAFRRAFVKTLYDLRWHPSRIGEALSTYRWFRSINYHHYLWSTVIERRVPFVKVELLRDNPRLIPTTGLLEQLRATSDYPVELIVDHLTRMASRQTELLAEGRRLVQQSALKPRSSGSQARPDARSVRGLRSR